jgi:hypothetical protein
MTSLVRSPWFRIWFALVLLSGLAYSFSVRSSSLLPGEALLVVGVGLIMLGGVVGSARTGKWMSWEGSVLPTKLEWFLGLTGFALFLSPLLHVLLNFLAGLVGLPTPSHL